MELAWKAARASKEVCLAEMEVQQIRWHIEQLQEEIAQAIAECQPARPSYFAERLAALSGEEGSPWLERQIQMAWPWRIWTESFNQDIYYVFSLPLYRKEEELEAALSRLHSLRREHRVFSNNARKAALCIG